MTHHYSLQHTLLAQAQKRENKHYIGYGITATMREDGKMTQATVEDITYDLCTAQRLLTQVIEYRVSPLCLTMFVEQFLSEAQHTLSV